MARWRWRGWERRTAPNQRPRVCWGAACRRAVASRTAMHHKLRTLRSVGAAASKAPGTLCQPAVAAPSNLRRVLQTRWQQVHVISGPCAHRSMCITGNPKKAAELQSRSIRMQGRSHACAFEQMHATTRGGHACSQGLCMI